MTGTSYLQDLSVLKDEQEKSLELLIRQDGRDGGKRNLSGVNMMASFKNGAGAVQWG